MQVFTLATNSHGLHVDGVFPSLQSAKDAAAVIHAEMLATESEVAGIAPVPLPPLVWKSPKPGFTRSVFDRGVADHAFEIREYTLGELAPC